MGIRLFKSGASIVLSCCHCFSSSSLVVHCLKLIDCWPQAFSLTMPSKPKSQHRSLCRQIEALTITLHTYSVFAVVFCFKSMIRPEDSKPIQTPYPLSEQQRPTCCRRVSSSLLKASSLPQSEQRSAESFQGVIECQNLLSIRRNKQWLGRGSSNGRNLLVYATTKSFSWY